MFYELNLQTAGMAAGALLVLLAVPGFLKPALVQNWWKRLPRSGFADIVLLSLADALQKEQIAFGNARYLGLNVKTGLNSFS